MGACWTEIGAGLLEPVGLSLGVSVCNLQLFWSLLKVQVWAVCWQPALGLFERVWGCMLASCSFCGAYGSDFGAACWQPTVRLGACWNEFGAVCLQPTAILEPIGPSLGLYVGNLQVLWGPLDRVWCCMLATYRSLLSRVLGRSHGGYWTNFGAVSWPSCFHRHTRPALTIQPPS